MEKNWLRCFYENGLLGMTDAIRERVRQAGHLLLPLIGAPPSDDDLAVIIGRRRPGLAVRLNRAAAQNALQEAAPMALVDVSVRVSSSSSSTAVSSAAVAPPIPMSSRTRSRSLLL